MLKFKENDHDNYHIFFLDKSELMMGSNGMLTKLIVSRIFEVKGQTITTFLNSLIKNKL